MQQIRASYRGPGEPGTFISKRVLSVTHNTTAQLFH